MKSLNNTVQTRKTLGKYGVERSLRPVLRSIFDYTLLQPGKNKDPWNLIHNFCTSHRECCLCTVLCARYTTWAKSVILDWSNKCRSLTGEKRPWSMYIQYYLVPLSNKPFANTVVSHEHGKSSDWDTKDKLRRVPRKTIDVTGENKLQVPHIPARIFRFERRKKQANP